MERTGLPDGAGIPPEVVPVPANQSAHQLVGETLETVSTERSAASKESPQEMWVDRGYDYSKGDAIPKELGCTTHICARGEESEQHSDSGNE